MQEIEEERGRFLSLLGNAVNDMVHDTYAWVGCGSRGGGGLEAHVRRLFCKNGLND